MDYIIDNIFYFIVILFGLALLVQGGRWVYESLIWAIYSQNKRIKEIPELLRSLTLAFFGNDDEASAKLNLMSTQAKSLATDIMGVKNFIPLYDFWANLGIVQERERVNKIGRGLIFLSNAANKRSAAPYVLQQIKDKIINIEDYLELDKDKRSISPDDAAIEETAKEEKQSSPQDENSQVKSAEEKGTVTSPE